MTNPEGPYVKVHFRLEIVDGWPPASVESLWTVDQGDGTVRLDNIPWFVRGIACGDIVTTEPDEEGVRWAGEVVGRSENWERFGMVALDVPPTADLAKVQKLLNHGVVKEWWHMEEGCITAQWRAASAGWE
ncbi:DUF4265 domain-containing protein [Streptomyces sp. NPDC002676]